MTWSSANFLTAALAAYLLGGVGALLAVRRERLANALGFGGAALAGLLGVNAAVSHLIGSSAAIRFALAPSLIPLLQFTVRLDGLGAFFVLIVSALGLALSVYSIGYVRSYYGRKSVGVMGAFYNLLLLTITLVFVADNAFLFLIAWEVMALSAFCLVAFEHEHRETRDASVLFLVMSHIGAGCLVLAFLLLVPAGGSYDFANLRESAATLPPLRRDLVFLLFLVGFGIKAGLVPLHVWLPAAHPVAPSNVSALMSGVLIKTGIYGLTRVLFDFFSAPPLWWGVTILVLGVLSAVLGVLYALMEHDLKRLLAYHSIENIGIILMGLGAALLFVHTRDPRFRPLAAMALVAALFHTFNHALFKALLFLGAGAVVQGAHTRNMEEMGGLIRRMPMTAFLFLIGAVAISGLPPLNGFVSEWLTYQSLLHGFGSTDSLVKLLFPIAGALLALTGALAAACFVKAFGITFLAQPRSSHALQTQEASTPMLSGMTLLAMTCIFLGLFPTVFVGLFDAITLQLVGESIGARLSTFHGLVLGSVTAEAGGLNASVSNLGLALTALCLLPIPLVLRLWLGRGTRARLGPTWDCGLKGLTPRMEYTATGFSKPLRMIFRGLFRPRREVQAEFEFSRYFATTLRFESSIEETFVKRLYTPLNHGILKLARRMRAIQAGSVQAYLLYIFITLLLLLIFAL